MGHIFVAVRRVHVVGSSGSGKSTFARKIAEHFDIPAIELDAIYHQSDWTPLDPQQLRDQVDVLTQWSDWVVDGNYSAVADLVDGRATSVIFLDYPRAFIMRRLIRRTFIRAITRKQLWNGNRERVRNLFKLDPEKNVLLWSWRNHAKLRARYLDPKFLGENATARMLVLPSHRAAMQFLQDLGIKKF